MYRNLKLRLHHGNVTWLSVGGQWRLTSCSITTKEEELRLSAGPRRRSYTCITSVFNFCHILFLSPASSHTLCVCMCVSACVCHTVNLSSFLATQITCNMNRFMVGPTDQWATTGCEGNVLAVISVKLVWCCDKNPSQHRWRRHDCEDSQIPRRVEMTLWKLRTANGEQWPSKVPRRGTTWRRTLWSAQ